MEPGVVRRVTPLPALPALEAQGSRHPVAPRRYEQNKPFSHNRPCQLSTAVSWRSLSG
jgi:hypothetical protein